MTVDSKINARDLARSVLVDCGGDRNAAFARLLKRAKHEPPIEAAIREAIPLETLIRDLLGDASHGIRMQTIRMANAAPGAFSPSQMASLLYLQPLANGTPARYAKRADWQHHIEHYMAKIHGLRLEVAFARRVIQHFADDTITTEDVLTADALLELREEAGREVGQ